MPSGSIYHSRTFRFRTSLVEYTDEEFNPFIYNIDVF